MTWQPIETAPKDGTWIMLTGGDIVYRWDGESKPPVVCAQAYRPEPNSWQFAWYDSGFYGEYVGPTHWAPIPDLLPKTA